jgi:DnaK suppressor protein
MTKTASPMSRKQILTRASEQLRDTKTRLSEQAGSELRAERDGDRGDGLDSSDRASEECDRDISSALSERERIKISQIDAALERITEMKYGLCENCGFEISEERLAVMPFTRLCHDCQQDHERAAKTRRRYAGDQDQVQDFASTHAEEGNNNGSMRRSWNESET